MSDYPRDFATSFRGSGRTLFDALADHRREPRPPACLPAVESDPDEDGYDGYPHEPPHWTEEDEEALMRREEGS